MNIEEKTKENWKMKSEKNEIYQAWVNSVETFYSLIRQKWKKIRISECQPEYVRDAKYL